MSKPAFPIHPRHPERICWGCNRYCSVDDMFCGNEVERAPHPMETFGDDWLEWAEKANDRSGRQGTGTDVLSGR